MMRNDCSSQKGNVLFLILIAVALFAALSYAVTSSSKGGGSGISKDKAKLHASEITQYGTQVEQTISRLMVMNQCSNTQISFENSVVSGYVNPNAPADKSCHVFDAGNGGGLPFKSPSAHLSDESDIWYIGRTCVVDVGSGQDGCHSDNSGSDLVMYIPHIHKEICLEINRKLGIPTVSGDAPRGDNNEYYRAGGSKFVGAYNNGGLAQTGGVGEAANFNGKYSGCFQGTGNAHLPAGYYHYYHVLIAR